jgi:hypothetical protein
MNKKECKFKIGDKVRCIDDKAVANRHLELGKIYTITSIPDLNDNRVSLKGLKHCFWAFRFELVEEPKVKKKSKPVEVLPMNIHHKALYEATKVMFDIKKMISMTKRFKKGQNTCNGRKPKSLSYDFRHDNACYNLYVNMHNETVQIPELNFTAHFVELPALYKLFGMK